MTDIPGIKQPELSALPQIGDRMTFVYVEHAVINRRDGAITVTNQDGIIYLPAASISVLILGPGTDVSHRAMELIGDAGVTVIWTGEHGVRYYASGQSLTHRAGLLLEQAKRVNNQRLHLDVVRKMYQLRFPQEDVSTLTLQQLRGREGSRIRNVYRECSKKWNVPWNGREYDPENFEASDTVNKALSMGHTCLYGLAHAVIAALGCSPGLGFVHVGHDCSFVYDIADLYKAEVTIPVAFETAAQNTDDLEKVVRHRVRDELVKRHILERMVHDIQWLLKDTATDDESIRDAVYLWDNRLGTVANGKQYHEAAGEKS
ncbi:type I-E CRISPR-associated endonuclease Cas1e [Acidaminococcus sp.]|uniref:type I-E CRISPR-associated endonuclease Cas1e n=1 Tax=Acidaminococcus sp. TaxID=1872103 RepID=UPI003D7D00A7